MRAAGVVAAALWLLSACGFEPVYGNREGRTDAVEVMRFIAVETAPGRHGELLKAEIEDRLNPEAIAAPARYRLKVDLQPAAEPSILEPDGTASRYTLKLVAPYRMIRIADNAELASGTVRHQLSYNVSERDDYSTIIGQQDAMRRGLTEVAEDVKQRISAVVARAAAAQP